MGTTQVDTPTQILDVAERLVQERGFNGFSYADVAKELGVTKAALHYHFPGKAELGEALIARYTSRFAEALRAIEAQQAPASAKLDAYLGLYVDVLRAGRMCLCGMLAAEYETLSKRLRQSILQFFDDNEAWLAGVLEQGRKDGELHFEGAPSDTARALISGLEGAMLVSRPYADPTRFERSGAALLATLAGIRPRTAPGSAGPAPGQRG
jgi:TetR/AcrR family transcriptional regulator, transcriptional repressor for nem operon